MLVSIDTRGAARLPAAVRVRLTRETNACQLETGLLSRREQSHLEERIVPSRRREWIRGRRACKEAIGALVGAHIDHRRFEILPGPQGEPRAFLPGGAGRVHVSVAHAPTLSVAVASHHERVGIDVERVAPVARRLWRYFLSPDEEARCEADPGHALRLWVLKEAIFKALGGQRPVPLRSLVPEVGHGFLRLTSHRVEALAYTLLPFHDHLFALVHP